MKILFALVSLILMMSLNSTALAEGNHTPNICSDRNSSVCAHLGHFRKWVVGQSLEFMVHAITPNDEEIEGLIVTASYSDGNSGHSLAPIELTKKGPNKYWASGLIFDEDGEWKIQLSFKFKGEILAIDFPILVEN